MTRGLQSHNLLVDFNNTLYIDTRSIKTDILRIEYHAFFRLAHNHEIDQLYFYLITVMIVCL